MQLRTHGASQDACHAGAPQLQARSMGKDSWAARQFYAAARIVFSMDRIDVYPDNSPGERTQAYGPILLSSSTL